MSVQRWSAPGPAEDVPWISTEDMVEVDRAMIQDYGVDLARMMENAGRCVADLARRRFLGGDPRDQRVLILAGKGGNGGGALACARRLLGWGADVAVHLAAPVEDFRGVPAQQLEILHRMEVKVAQGSVPTADAGADLVVDGILGYGLRGAPRGEAADLVRWSGRQGAPVLALDVPSGVEAGSGRVHDPAVRAAATLTLALPKEGLRAPEALPRVGELYLADIGVPPMVYGSEPLGLEVGPIFAVADVVRL